MNLSRALCYQIKLSDFREEVRLTEKIAYCPVCGEVMLREEGERFGMCLDCFIEELTENIRDDIVRDFLREYGYDLRIYVLDNYF